MTEPEPPISHIHTGHTTFTSIKATAETIAALERGASADARIAAIQTGDGIAIPIAVQQTATGPRVEVLRDVMDESDGRRPWPIRRRGTTELGDLPSLIAYVNRFKVPQSVAFASAAPPEITVVFDHDGPGGDNAGWRSDRAVYRCPLSRQWQFWTGLDGKPLGQGEFGDLIDANADDIRAGADDHAPAAAMLEVARKLVINQVGKFARTIDPASGTGTLTVVDEHDKATSTKIPRAFGLAIPVFEGAAELYAVEARIRFAMVEGRPRFTFVLHNRAAVFERALAELRNAVAAACSIPVFVGKAPAPAVVR